MLHESTWTRMECKNILLLRLLPATHFHLILVVLVDCCKISYFHSSARLQLLFRCISVGIMHMLHAIENLMHHLHTSSGCNNCFVMRCCRKPAAKRYGESFLPLPKRELFHSGSDVFFMNYGASCWWNWWMSIKFIHWMLCFLCSFEQIRYVCGWISGSTHHLYSKFFVDLFLNAFLLYTEIRSH